MGALILITTLTLGAVYSLIGVGFVVMFRATGVLSFAQGAFFLLASLIFYSLTNDGLGLWAGLVVATILVGLAGAHQVEMPIAEQVDAIVAGRCSPLEALLSLMDRPSRPEWDEELLRGLQR